MMKKMFGRRQHLSLALIALVAATAGYFRAPLGGKSSSVRLPDLARRSAAEELPQGFVLPSSDVDLGVSSLVAADLDADGDLDIVATDSASIVVWVNDGDGRLTRKRPASPKNLGGEPASPSVEQRQGTVVVSVQPNSPAVQTLDSTAWLTPPVRASDLQPSRAATSVDLARLRSRSPPLLS
jgi:hypothetical protein